MLPPTKQPAVFGDGKAEAPKSTSVLPKELGRLTYLDLKGDRQIAIVSLLDVYVANGGVEVCTLFRRCARRRKAGTMAGRNGRTSNRWNFVQLGFARSKVRQSGQEFEAVLPFFLTSLRRASTMESRESSRGAKFSWCVWLTGSSCRFRL